MSEEDLLYTRSVDFTPLDRWEFRQRSNRLEESLLSRLSLSVLSQRGILDDSELAASLHSAASKVNHKLAHRSSITDLQYKNILPLMADSTEQIEHVDHIYHTRKESLQEAMENRPGLADIADLGYIDDSGMAPRLQPTALRLNRRLTERKTRDDLIAAGIIAAEETANDTNEVPNEREKKKKKKKSKVKRKSRSEKQEKTPSIIWHDVKKKGGKAKKSKKITVGKKGDIEYSVGDRVRLTKARSGTIKYIGKPHFSKKAERIGIELDKYTKRGHDGRVDKFRYFNAKYGHGTFVTKAAIVEKLKSADTNVTGATQFEIGDYVLVKDDRKGIIRYIGSTGIVRGCLVGVELDEKSPAGHDGRFGGKNYFQCPEGHGIFVRLIDVIKVIKTKKEMDIDTIPDDIEISEETISDALSLGDRVTLANHKQGIIKYIGSTDFSENKPMLGIELDEDDPTAQDGSVGAKTYFNSRMGRGIFVRRASVVAVGDKQLAQFIKDHEDKKEDDEEEDESGDDEEEEEEEITLEVGDYVETESGVKGIIKFIGSTDFAKGELIGLEMEAWDPDGHDGSRNNKRYFQCKQGHGFWTRKHKIKRYLQTAGLNKQEIQKLLKRPRNQPIEEALEDMDKEKQKASQTDLFTQGLKIETDNKFDGAKVGDRVELERNKMGTIRYIGEVKFNSSEEVIGIELDKFDAQAHDGRGYFETKKGHGYAIFKTINQIKQLIPMDKLATPKLQDRASLQGAFGDNEIAIAVHDRVRLKNGRTGVIRWKGIIIEDDGGDQTESCDMVERYGIELDISDSSANSGFYNDTKYFNCAPNRGLFVKYEMIIENLGQTTNEWLHHKYTIINDGNTILRVNMRVQCLIAGPGVIRYLGNPAFVDDLMYGIELDSWSPNATNGFVNGEEFFQCEQGKAFFVGKESIIKCITVEDPELIEASVMGLPVLTNKPRMHDKVKLVDGQIGVIAFIGMLEFSSDTYIGIKLDTWSANGNDGSAAGKKYFKCEPGHGYFITLVDIAAHLGSIISTSFKNVIKDKQKKTENLLKVGDKVRLQDGGVGTVKYIGNTHFNENEMVGIELDQWNANGHNGKIKGRTYFKASPGCGTFARRNSIMERLSLSALGLSDGGDEDDVKLPPLPLPDAGDLVKLKNGDEGIVQWIETNSSLKNRQKQIQIQVTDSQGDAGGVSSIKLIKLDDIEENLGRQTTEDREAVTDDKIKVGTHVRLTRGKTGFIRYIGTVGNVDELIGIELDSWTHNGHDGKGHFKCPIGRGYFTKRTNIIGIISVTEKSTQEQLQLKRHRNIRKLRKKIRKISMLEQKAKNGLKLTDEHQQQLLNKVEYQRQLQELQQAFARNTPAIQIDDIVKHDIIAIQKVPEVAMYDTVILDTGERGRVVFIGDVHFDDHEMLGIVLEKWSPNAHNGSIDGKSYFVAPDGRGLLVPLSAVHDVDTAGKKRASFSRSNDADAAYPLGDAGDSSLSNLKVGDEVQLGAKKGRVKFLGTTEFSKDEPVLGIELDEWSANANDGTIQGKKYFDTSPGKGFFMRKQSYMNLADMINASDFASENPENEILRRDSVVIHDVSSILPIEYELGDKVRLENGDIGVIKFIGKTAFCQDKLIGVELDKWSPNGHNGKYKETPYFDAVDGRGFFVRHDLIISKINPDNPMPLSSLHDKNVGIRPPNTRIGDRIRLKNGLVGIIRFQGRVDFSDDVYVGMSLEKKHYNGNDGQAHGRRYFNTKKGRGYFAKKTEIARILTSSGAQSLRQMKNVKSLTEFPKLGDKVRTIKGKTGVVKYMGTTSFAKGVLIGLELDQWWPNGHDGSVKKARYFSCPTGRGYFTRLSHLVANLGSHPADHDSDVIKDYQDEKTSHSNAVEGDADLPGFKVGDRVKLQHGKTGVVRYIGTPGFSEEELVGIELDSWSANAGDGSVQGEKVFATTAGRGYFTRRKSVANIIQSTITEGAYARLKGLLRVPKFNGKTVKIVAYVEKKGRWKVKLLHAKQEKKYLGVREENLDPILDWEPISSEKQAKVLSLVEYPSIGERVKTRKGRYGIVKYVGPVDFSPSSKDTPHIGLELEQWDPNGHNGTVKDKKYFVTMDGRGYFVKLDNLVENLGRPKTDKEIKKEKAFEEANKPKAPLPAPPKVKQGDRVKLARGRTGTVKYIGPTEFSNGKEVIGLELDTYDAGASDKHKKYFDAPSGRGYFTRRASVANIILSTDLSGEDKYDKTTRRLISRTKKKLREIEVLAFKHGSGVVLHPNQIAKMNRKEELQAKLEQLKRDGLKPKKPVNPMGGGADAIREKVRILARKTSIDWTGKFAGNPIIDVALDDAVRIANGGTGVVRYIGPIAFLGEDENVIGVLMDQWHPSYGNGTIDAKKYFNCDDGRGYFAHPPEITENLGSTKPKKEIAPMAPAPMAPALGTVVKLKDGQKGVVKYVGPTEFSDGQAVVGVELAEWSANTGENTVNEKYFGAAPGRSYFARMISISGWKVPTDLVEEAKRLDEDADSDDEDPIDSAQTKDGSEISVNIGDRIVTVRGYTGVVRFKGGVHFDEREAIGIELDQWSPNGHNGIIHGHKYFSCTEGRGYFIRKNGIQKNMGATRRRRKSRTQSMMDFGLITKNLKIGDHIKLARGKTGVVKYLGKSSDINTNDNKSEDIVGIELDEWSANGNDGKSMFKTSKGRGYFARRASIANIILPNNAFTDLEEDETQIEANNIERQIQKIEKKLREIEVLEQKQKSGEVIDTKQLVKIDRKRHLKEKLAQLKQELASIKARAALVKTRRSLEDETSIKTFQKRRRNSISKEESLRNIQHGDRVRLVRGKTGIVKYLGSVDFTDEEVVGIILDKWHPNANNGVVKGKQYFKAPPGRGYFAKRALIIENLGSVSLGNLVHGDIASGAPMPKINFKIGDRVKLARGKTGLVKFIGETEFAKGEVIGLQLDTWTPAGHNGTVRNKKYFEAADGRGYFTRRSSISTVVIPLVKPLKQRRLSITYKLNPLQISDRIRLTNDNKTGVIRYIGYPSFADGEVIGIELDDWSVNAHDGSANGISVFDTSPGRGIFARRDEVEKYDPEKEKLEEIKKNLKLGDTVILTGNRKGHVKYIGPVTGQDEMIGVELESWSPDAKDGRFDGFRYFTAPDGRGVFIKRSAIVDVIPLENDPDIKQALGIKKSGDRRESDTDMDDEEKEYFVADRVVIEGGNKGYIRYIGKDVKNEGVYGIELDLAVPKGTDGRHNNKRFFICRNNHAVFVRKHVIIQVIDEDEIVAPQIGNRVKLTKGRFGLIHNIHEQDDGLLEYNIHIDQLIDRQLTNKVDISHKRQHSSGGVRRMSVGGGGVYNPKSGRQSGLLDIEDSAYKKLMNGTVDDDSDNYDSDDDNYTALGETIELRSGKIGTIRFIGPVHFGKGNWIGVELHDEWGPHDGAVRGVRYFTCPPKRGIFVKQIKGRKKDDPTRQHLKRRCPECYGEFIKKRDPRAAYKSVGIVCDGCLKHGNEFSSNDWYFQCGQCEQTDFCLNCMLKLPAVSSDDMLDSYQNVRAKFKPIGAEWIFEDIHNDDEDTENDLDTENERKLLEEQEEQKTSSKFLHAPIKTIFDHFDKNNDGLIDDSDIHDLFKASKRELQERLFANKLPMRYPQFEQCWKDIAPPAAQNILEYISHHMKNQISIIFDFFDVDKNGLLEEDDVVRMLRMAGKKNKIDTVITQVLTPMNVEHFLHSWSSFDIDCSFFLRYILTRIQIETERRRMKHRARQPSLIFKPVPNLPSGTVSDGSTSSSDFDVDEDSDDEMNDDKLIVIDDDTLEDIMFQIAAILPYYDDSFEEYAYLPKTGRESIEMLEKVRDIFEFFDLAMNGTLTVADMESMMPIIDIDWNAKAKTKSLFDPPCDFIKFLAKIQAASTMEASNILDKLLSFIHLKIQDVFHTFCENNDNINESQIKVMYNYAYKLESDWRTTFTFPCNLSSFIENWSIMGLYEQRGILDETAKRLHQRLQNIYDCFDVEDRKVLNTEQITELLQLIKIDANSSKQFKVFQAPLSFDQFKRGMNLLHRSLTSDILPPLEDYVKAKNPQLFEETQEELKQQELSEQQRLKPLGVASKRRESSIIQKLLYNRPPLAEMIAKNILDVAPEIDPETAQAMKKLKRVRDMIILNRRIPLRPTPQQLYDRNIAPHGAFDVKGHHDALKAREQRRMTSVMNLTALFKQRPDIDDLKKYINPLLDRHDHFENTTNQQQEIINPLHRQHRPQMAQEPEQKKPPSKPRNRQFYPADGQLVKRMEKRPTEKELRDRGILYDDTQRKEHRRRASQNLLHSLAQRPTFSDLVERGILQNENQQFNERIRRLVTLIEQVNMDESIKSHQYAVINEIKDDYTGMTVRLNGQLFEYKETLNQFQDDVQSREQRYRQELEKKQLVLIHMNGMIEQQTKDNKLIKNEYEEKMREMRVEFEDKLEKNKILNEMKGGKSDPNHRNQIQLKIKQYLEYLRSMSSQLQQELKQYHMHSSSAKQMQQLEQQRQQINTTIDNLHDLALALGNAAPSSGGSGQFGMVTHQYETKIKKQKEQITKLKQQKKEMVKVVNEKMRDLKYMHQQELQKERQIANVLVENQKKQMESWKDRHASGGQVDNNDYRVMQMQQQMEKLKKMYKQSLMENDALRKSKQKLEKMVVKLSSNIVQTARKK
eukprot:559723_1